MIACNDKLKIKMPKKIKLSVCSCGYKLVCVDHKFVNPFKSYLGEDVA